MRFSINSFIKKVFTKGNQGWGGENLTSNEFGLDTGDAEPFGAGMFGGIKHFKKRSNVNINHNS